MGQVQDFNYWSETAPLGYKSNFFLKGFRVVFILLGWLGFFVWLVCCVLLLFLFVRHFFWFFLCVCFVGFLWFFFFFFKSADILVVNILYNYIHS